MRHGSVLPRVAVSLRRNKDGKAKCGCSVLEGRSNWAGQWSGKSDSGHSSQGC